jgi:hypothetical protein
MLWSREHMVLRQPAGLELHRQQKLMLHEFLQMAQCNSGRSPVLLNHGSGKREGQHLQDPSISSYFLLLFFTLPFFVPSSPFCSGTRNEIRRKQLVRRMDVGVRKGDHHL